MFSNYECEGQLHMFDMFDRCKHSIHNLECSNEKRARNKAKAIKKGFEAGRYVVLDDRYTKPYKIHHFYFAESFECHSDDCLVAYLARPMESLSWNVLSSRLKLVEKQEELWERQK